MPALPTLLVIDDNNLVLSSFSGEAPHAPCAASYYYQPATETAANLALMALIDHEYTAHPFLGSRRLTSWLRGEGHAVNRKRVQRLMRLMGLEAVRLPRDCGFALAARWLDQRFSFFMADASRRCD